MLKILVVSDSHGDVSILNDLFLSHQDFDYFFHLGDSELPSYQLYPFISVRGNNDYFDYPISKLIHTKYGDFYLEHGNHHIDDEYIRSKNARFFYMVIPIVVCFIPSTTIFLL